MPDSAVIADVSETLPTLTLEERSGTPEETLRKGATISLDDIRFNSSNRPPAVGAMSVIDRQGDRDE